MRTHGTLAKWNDDRGFGFITPSKGASEIFVHISAFPRDGTRPQLNELISYEVEVAPDGRQRAVRVMRPAQKAGGRAPAPANRKQQHDRPKIGAFSLLVAAVLAAFGYSKYVNRGSAKFVERAEPATSFACDGRTRCPEMKSCEEATYFIQNCPNTKMDGDGDGVPCEDQWCR